MSANRNNNNNNRRRAVFDVTEGSQRGNTFLGVRKLLEIDPVDSLMIPNFRDLRIEIDEPSCYVVYRMCPHLRPAGRYSQVERLTMRRIGLQVDDIDFYVPGLGFVSPHVARMYLIPYMFVQPTGISRERFLMLLDRAFKPNGFMYYYSWWYVVSQMDAFHDLEAVEKYCSVKLEECVPDNFRGRAYYLMSLCYSRHMGSSVADMAVSVQREPVHVFFMYYMIEYLIVRGEASTGFSALHFINPRASLLVLSREEILDTFNGLPVHERNEYFSYVNHARERYWTARNIPELEFESDGYSYGDDVDADDDYDYRIVNETEHDVFRRTGDYDRWQNRTSNIFFDGYPPGGFDDLFPQDAVVASDMDVFLMKLNDLTIAESAARFQTLRNLELDEGEYIEEYSYNLTAFPFVKDMSWSVYFSAFTGVQLAFYDAYSKAVARARFYLRSDDVGNETAAYDAFFYSGFLLFVTSVFALFNRISGGGVFYHIAVAFNSLRVGHYLNVLYVLSPIGIPPLWVFVPSFCLLLLKSYYAVATFSDLVIKWSHFRSDFVRFVSSPTFRRTIVEEFIITRFVYMFGLNQVNSIVLIIGSLIEYCYGVEIYRREGRERRGLMLRLPALCVHLLHLFVPTGFAAFAHLLFNFTMFLLNNYRMYASFGDIWRRLDANARSRELRRSRASRFVFSDRELDSGDMLVTTNDNPSYNSVCFNKLLRGSVADIFILGRTSFGTSSWPIYVECNLEQFKRFLKKVRGESHKWRDFFLKGRLHVSLLEEVKELYFRSLCSYRLTSSISLDVNLPLVELIGHVLSLFRSIVNNDPIGLIAAVASKSTIYVGFLEQFRDLSMKDMRSLFGMDVVMTGGYKDETRTTFLDYLPSHIGKSVTVRRVFSLCGAIFGATFLKDHFERFLDFISSGNVDLSSLDGASSWFDLIVGSFSVIVKGVQRVIETRDYKSFFVLPKAVEFCERANAILRPVSYTKSVAQVEEEMCEICCLIESMRFENKTPEIGRLLSSLEDRNLYLGKLLLSKKPRLMPFVVFLSGEPGVGKTTLVDSIIAFCMKLAKIDRFVGDVVDVNLLDKYPGSAGINQQAFALVLNDIPQNYAEFPKQDLLPLDFFLQKAIDTSPFYLRGAAVEDKGVMLNSLGLVIITSNYDSFLCFESTKKLIRRFTSGVLAEMCSSELDGSRSFQVLKVASEDKRFYFEPLYTSQEGVAPSRFCIAGYDNFFAYLKDRWTKHVDFQKSKAKMFADSSAICSCGMALVLHEKEECQFTGSMSNVVSYFHAAWLVYSAVQIYSLYLAWIPFLDYIVCYLFGVSVVRFRYAVSFFLMKKKATDFVITNYPAIVAITGGFFLSSMYSKFSHLQMSGNNFTLFRDDVVPDSIVTSVVAQNSQLPGARPREWGSNQSPVGVIVPNTRGVGIGDLIVSVKNSLEIAKLRRNGNVAQVVVFIFSPDYVMFNKHYLFDGDVHCDEFSLEIRGIVSHVAYSEVLTSDDCDYVLVTNVFARYVPSLNKFFARDLDCSVMDIVVVHPNWTKHTIGKISSFPVPFSSVLIPCIQWNLPGENGDCGAVVIAKAKDAVVVVGIVSFTATSPFGSVISGATLFKSVNIDKLLQGRAYPLVNTVLTSFPLVGELSVQSEFLNVRTPWLLVVGTESSKTSTFKSKFKRSPLYDSVVPFLKDRYDFPKRIRGMCKEGSQWSSAVITTFKNSALQDTSFAYIKRLAFKAYLRDVLKNSDGVYLKPLDLSEAFFGKEDLGISRIDFSTSVGPSLKTQGIRDKFDLFIPEGDKYRLNPQFRDRVQFWIDQLREGNLPFLKMDLTPKDEVRPVSKLDVYKIRLFSVVDFEYNVVARMYLMPLITFLLTRPFSSGCFGGMNAGSLEWNALANYLQSFGDDIVDMDFSSFDMSHGIQMFIGVAEFYYDLAVALGYDTEEACIVYYLFVVLCNQIASFMSDVVLKMKGMPSGVVPTLSMNSVINSVLMRMAFIKLTGKSVFSFRDFVKEATVGDDNVSGVSKEILEVYNSVTIFEYYKSVGYIATPASKSGDVVPFSTLAEMQFLKRRFVFDERFHAYVAPLEMDSIWKALAFEKLDSGVSSSQRLYQIAQAASLEFYLHGDDVFDREVFKMEGMFRLAGIPFPDIPSKVDLKERYLSGGFRTFAL